MTVNRERPGQRLAETARSSDDQWPIVVPPQNRPA